MHAAPARPTTLNLNLLVLKREAEIKVKPLTFVLMSVSVVSISSIMMSLNSIFQNRLDNFCSYL